MDHLTVTLRNFKHDKGMTEADLAATCHLSRPSISHYLAGRRNPTLETARILDRALGAAGEVITAWHTHQRQRADALAAGRILDDSVPDSLRLTATDQGTTVAELLDDAEALPVASLWEAPAAMLTRAVQVRAGLLDVLARGRFLHHQAAAIQRALSVTTGTLTYAALDLGHPTIALQHLDASRAMAERADDLEGLVWVAGTESLVRRFLNDYPAALAAIEQGLTLGDVPGTGRVRLLAGLGQCRANLGDTPGAHEALDLAATAREHVTTPDASGGLYHFTDAKQTYYTGSSLIHLPDEASNQRAILGAQQAIDVWAEAEQDENFTKDAILCRLYQALAYLNLGDLAGVAERVAPVIALPTSERISWVTKRLTDISSRLAKPPWANSTEAQALRDLIR